MTRAIAQMRWELRLLLRNGEQILVMFLIPLALLVALQLTGVGSDPVPSVLTVSVMATCFTALAIATGFERRSGALRYAAATPLTRLELLAGKLLATLVTATASTLTVAIVGAALGWRPATTWAWAIPGALLGGAAFAAIAVLLAGTVRAEAVLAIANGLFILLIVFGGVLIPVTSMPPAVGSLVAVLPSAALADVMRATLADAVIPWTAMGILLAWAAIASAIARRAFRWD